MMPLVIYTARIGTIDRLRQPRCPLPNFPTRFVCFTDQPFETAGRWEIRQVSGTMLPCGQRVDSPRRVARYYKLMAHEVLPDARAWIWHDACMVLRSDPHCLSRLATAKAPLATFKHPDRDCVYDEHRACLRYRKGEPERMQQQIDYMQFCGYPPGNGLAETACLVRRNCEAIRRFNVRWWELLNAYSVRDQLSFDFACWETGMTYGHLQGSRRRTPHFITFKH